jgi:transcriptional regulator GlxA family with amidase domain
VLWRVAHLTTSAGASRAPAAVATAIAYIESHLASPLTVPQVTAAARVSHNHLTRLFRAQTGLTVVAYLRDEGWAPRRARSATTPTRS